MRGVCSFHNQPARHQPDAREKRLPLCYLTRGNLPSSANWRSSRFFILSGLLIAHSWNSMCRWLGLSCQTHGLRIYPAFLATILFCTFVVAPLASPTGWGLSQANRRGYVAGRSGKAESRPCLATSLLRKPTAQQRINVSRCGPFRTSLIATCAFWLWDLLTCCEAAQLS